MRKEPKRVSADKIAAAMILKLWVKASCPKCGWAVFDANLDCRKEGVK